MYSQKTYKRMAQVLLGVTAVMALAALISGSVEFWLGAVAGCVAVASFGLCSLLAGDVAPGDGQDETDAGLFDGARSGLPKHNPASGLDMLDGDVDVHGNPYGINS